jgi:exodeoxyribonuclease V alpha subunit
MIQKTLSLLYESGSFSLIDLRFAEFIAKLAKKSTPDILLAAALVSRHKQAGHICLDLSSLKKAELPVPCPEPEEWLVTLRESDAVGHPGEYKPLILDDKGRLYLYRYWDYQEKLAFLIRERVNEAPKDLDRLLLKEGLDRVFPDNGSNETDWQKVAAFTALTKKFCVISGGPGTGKTATIAKILSLILEQNSRQKIALAAPTGKAAARLQESVSRSKKNIFSDNIPEPASTLHRLLGTIPGSPYFRYNAKNRLSADVVVIDEASMVDMAMMSKLVQALSPSARLILLGDKDQLASVEAGAVLGDICDTGNIHSFSEAFRRDFRNIADGPLSVPSKAQDEPKICDCIVQLQKSYRFGEDSGIRAVSHAVNSGEPETALQYMHAEKYKDICWKNLPGSDLLERNLRDAATEGFEDYLKAVDDPFQVFRLFDRFRILCALKSGPFGVPEINKVIERILKRRGLILPDRKWYKGRPVLITSNDYNLRLFNGDVGIVLPDPGSGGDLRVFFPNEGEAPRKLHPLRLPEHETVYAMTVHKSQGSEFDKVILLLPDRDSPVLTRELIYTGITRARDRVEIWGTESVFRNAVRRRIERTSGMRDALWE